MAWCLVKPRDFTFTLHIINIGTLNIPLPSNLALQALMVQEDHHNPTART
jgi:hypothetical protein